MLAGSALRPFESSGAHEAGHAMGLNDIIPDTGDPNYISPTMDPVSLVKAKGGEVKELRNKPSGREWEQILNKNHINVNKKYSTYLYSK